jgi:hypothetical protein
MPVPISAGVIGSEEYLRIEKRDEAASQYLLVSRSALGWRVTWKSASNTGR